LSRKKRQKGAGVSPREGTKRESFGTMYTRFLLGVNVFVFCSVLTRRRNRRFGLEICAARRRSRGGWKR
jgi:hypothetical protein